MFNVIYGQYELVNDKSNVISLIEIFCKICYRRNCEMYKPQVILFSVKALINYLQHKLSIIDYFPNMRNQKKVFILIDIQLSYEPLYEQMKGLLYPNKQL